MQICPDCQRDLTEVSFESEKAGKIHCFYCSNCGGSFFEHWDSNLLSIDDIKRELERIFSQEESVGKTNLEPECPIDGATMHPIASEAVPAGVRVYACPTCHGNWFPKADLVKFKEMQTRKIFKFKNLGIPLASVSAVFLPAMFLAIMTGVMIYTKNKVIDNKNTYVSTASGFQKMIQIKDTKKNSVEILFVTDEPSKSVISYKVPGGKVYQKEETDFSRYHYVLINNLTNPKDYLFQIKSTTISSKEYNSEWLSPR